MRVLVAEDEAVPRAILRAALEKLGHETLVAKDGANLAIAAATHIRHPSGRFSEVVLGSRATVS